MEEEKVNNTKSNNENIVIKKKSLKNLLIKVVSIIFILIVIIFLAQYFIKKSQEGKLVSIKNQAELERIINKSTSQGQGLNIVAELFSITDISRLFEKYYSPYPGDIRQTLPMISNDSKGEIMENANPTPSVSPDMGSSSSTDYSKTNVQVENIDEADVIKTDGGYVYSISENKVLITDVMNEKEPKVVAKIEPSSALYPMDLLINENKLIVISTSIGSGVYYDYNSNRTGVDVFDITNRSEPKKVKSLELNSSYNTSRMIDNQVYLFTKNNLNKYDYGYSYSYDYNYNYREESKDYEFREYKEDFKEKEIPFSNIKYVKTNPTKEITTFISFDLNSIAKDVNISSYFVNLDTAYISPNNIYLLDNKYNYWNSSIDISKTIKSMFGWEGIFGVLDISRFDDDMWGNSTKITKYSFSKDKTGIEYKEHTEVKGKIINQYSCDEKDGNLRIALNDNKGTRIKVLDENLNEIGDTGPAAKGEDNKSVRFVGDIAYFVTYKNVDPLFVIDLSNPRDPRIKGELKIPGFSNYLHPYDENHIIGIGMATNEEIIRDNFGRPISERITFNGMKMTLFDISDIKNPKEKDVVYFGDSRTDSPINTNAKALLYSKEKNLIAIPISNMGSVIPFMFENGTEEQRVIKNMLTIHENVSQGYIVFDLTTEGFKYKGIVAHEDLKENEENKYIYNYYNNSNPIRGLYIDNLLLTVSSKLLKINKLDTLEFISNIDLKSGELKKEEVSKTYIPSNVEKPE